jgi:hypothetical protein
LIKPEKLLVFSGQKRWIFLPGIGSPGKVGNNGIQEVVGSIPIGSTKDFMVLVIRMKSEYHSCIFTTVGR